MLRAPGPGPAAYDVRGRFAADAPRADFGSASRALTLRDVASACHKCVVVASGTSVEGYVAEPRNQCSPLQAVDAIAVSAPWKSAHARVPAASPLHLPNPHTHWVQRGVMAGARVGIPGPGAYHAAESAAIQAPSAPAYPFGLRPYLALSTCAHDTPVRLSTGSRSHNNTSVCILICAAP